MESEKLNKMDISTSTHQIISSGNVIVSKSDQLNFDFADLNLHFKISFKHSDEEDSHFNLKYHPEDGGFLEIEICNLGSPFFASSKQRINVAKYKDKQISVHLTFQDINENESLIVFYSWYKEK